jgi:hypothetical protein
MGAGADALCRTGSGSPGESTAATATASETGTRASARSSSPSRSCPRARTSPTGFPQYCHTTRGHSATRRSVALPRASSRTGVPSTTSSLSSRSTAAAGTPPSTSRRSRTPQRPTDATSTRVGAGSDLPRNSARHSGTTELARRQAGQSKPPGTSSTLSAPTVAQEARTRFSYSVIAGPAEEQVSLQRGPITAQIDISTQREVEKAGQPNTATLLGETVLCHSRWHGRAGALCSEHV